MQLSISELAKDDVEFQKLDLTPQEILDLQIKTDLLQKSSATSKDLKRALIDIIKGADDTERGRQLVELISTVIYYRIQESIAGKYQPPSVDS